MTSAKWRAPSLTEESLEHDATVDATHWLPPPMWQTEKAPHEEANWLRLREIKGQEDLECPPIAEDPPPGTPEWGRTIPGWCQGGIWLATPTNINAQRPGALSPVPVSMDTCGDANLVEETCEDPKP